MQTVTRREKTSVESYASIKVARQEVEEMDGVWSMDQQEEHLLCVSMKVVIRRSNLKDFVGLTEEKSAKSMVVGKLL